MSEAMDEAAREFRGRHEATADVAALVCMALEYDLKAVPAIGLVGEMIPNPGARHVAVLVHMIDAIIRDCMLSRSQLIRSIDALGQESKEEMLRCLSRVQEQQQATSFSRRLRSVDATHPEANSPDTGPVNGPYKPLPHTGISTSDSSEN